MMRILKWLVAALVVFLFLTEVVPRLRSRVEGVTEDKIVGRPDPMAGEASACVHLANLANALVGDEIYGAKPPPGDSTGWVEAGDEIRRSITEAEDACTCPQPGCLTAREAMEKLDLLVSDIDRMISGEASVAVTLANRQEQITVLLEQARIEAR